MPTLLCLSSLRVSFLQEGVERKDSGCRGSRQRHTSNDAAGLPLVEIAKSDFTLTLKNLEVYGLRKRYRHTDYVNSITNYELL
jgi:hypothetical protein